MRFLQLLLLFLVVTGYSTAQETPLLLGTKWYLNSAQISSFAWNDSSSIHSHIPSLNYIRFTSSQLEIGMDSSENQRAKSTFLEYRMIQGADHTGQISLYRTAKEKKKKMPFAWYEYKLTPSELMLFTYPESEFFPDIAHTETLIFSLQKDTLQLTTQLFGTWKSESAASIFYDELPSDTIVLKKSAIQKETYDLYFYTFERRFDQLICTGRYFVSPEVKGRMFYDVSHNYNYRIDIAKKQLIFIDKPANRVYDILEINARQLVLKLHRE
ncbi:hypothetical protein [Fluviicola sp.]|uniref:hypothetical protein n=1 Tax=Fluviicola sp. TaxID=1917219 RepID=UPI0031E32BD5